ncbi:MAG TPA: agmatinase [Syntrophales bacterium]|nr:agmatinase [Syntrophales bacterium]HPI56945.1 agmatinase [Syntrophales bacterium]HPN23531.1 agmatinase [Syntrophales bacterium]HQM27944.1 agmatinase [Syntrophales bacterium]
MNFGGIDKKFSEFKKAFFAVLPVPYDLTSTYQSGSRRGPSAILEASCNMELYDEELRRETYRAGIHTLPPLEPDARGPREMIKKVEESVAGIIRYNKVPVMLGGEHSISTGSVRALRKKYPRLSVLHFDAHADMRDRYQGSPYSHACVARRLSEICPVVQVGTRSMSREEALYIEKKGAKVFPPWDVQGAAGWEKKICENLTEDVYISVDLDVFDSALMPATGTPEPGGLTWRDVTSLLREVAGTCRIRGFDVVELSPIPGMVAPEFLAAKLTYRIMGHAL